MLNTGKTVSIIVLYHYETLLCYSRCITRARISGAKYGLTREILQNYKLGDQTIYS